MRRLLLVAAIATTAACATGREPTLSSSPTPQSAPSDAWASARGAAANLLDAGRYMDADGALSAFETRHAGTPQAAEATYWRALLRLDPANPIATPRDALAMIDAYLAGGAARVHYQEALVLRRTASVLESLRRPLPVAAEAPLVAIPDSTLGRAQVEEIQRLRGELQRAQAELERLKNRVRPDPPPR